MEVVIVLGFISGVINLIMAIVGGYGFGYAIRHLSPLGKLKFKPFSCLECLSFWGGGIAYWFITHLIPAAIVVGFITIIAAKFLGAIEYRIAGGVSASQPPCTGGCKGGTRLPKAPEPKGGTE